MLTWCILLNQSRYTLVLIRLLQSHQLKLGTRKHCSIRVLIGLLGARQNTPELLCIVLYVCCICESLKATGFISIGEGGIGVDMGPLILATGPPNI